MTKGHISKKTVCLFLLAGFVGFIAFLLYYERAFPEASINLKISREEAVALSRAFLAKQGFSLAGYRSVAIFDDERNTIDFVERRLGLDAANDLFRTILAVWKWKIRWFKELSEVEYAVELSPDGRLAGFSRVLPDSTPGARLSEEQARSKGEAFLSRELTLNLSSYRYIERMTGDHPARLDQELVWRYDGFKAIPDSEYRISVTLQGDSVAGYSQWLRIPEGWRIAKRQTESKRNLLSRFSYLPVMLLFLGVLVVFFWRTHAGGIAWRKSIGLAGVSAGVLLLAQMNELPLAFVSYETTKSLSTFWLEQLSSPAFSSVLAFLLFVPLFGATDVAGRLFLSERPWSTGLLSKEYLLSSGPAWQVILGYGMAFAAIGYVTLFYVIGERLLGVWSPVDVGFGSSFSTYFPSFAAVYTGFSAAFLEELVFRLFSVALLYKVTKRFWPSVVVPAVIWGFAHTTYPQEPIWIRGVELSIAGIGYGWIFLRYGILTTLTSHFLYNVFVGVVPQLQSGRAGPIAGALFALALPLIVIAFLRILRGRNLLDRFFVFRRGRLRQAVEAVNVGVADEIRGGEGAVVLSSGRPVWSAVLAAVVFVVSLLVPSVDLYDAPPPVTLTVTQAAKLCDRLRTQMGFDAKGYRSSTEFYDRAEAIPLYAVDRLGIREARDALGGFTHRDPQWITRWYKEKTIQKFQVAIDERGWMTGLDWTLADSDGGGRVTVTEARRIASDFLVTVGHLNQGDWEYIEEDKTERPNRTDYEFVYRDRRLKVSGLQRRLSITVSGSKVTSFSLPWYNAPGEWLRARDLEKQRPRNTVREIVGGVCAMAATVFLVIQLVLLFRRRLAKASDVRLSFVIALALGALPAFLGIINALPSFSDGYFYRTEQTFFTYSLMTLLSAVSRLIGTPAAIFSLLLVLQVVLRGWMPEAYTLRWFVDRIRPSSWKSPESGKGVIMGLSLAFLSLGIDQLGESVKTAVAPDLVALSPAVTGIDLHRLSEILTGVALIPRTVALCAGMLLLAVTLRKFLKGGGRIFLLFALVFAVTADTESLSWQNLLLVWSLELANFAVVFFAITRLIGWNPVAYLAWMWVDLNGPAIGDCVRFVLTPSPAFFWPSIQQLAVLVVPLAAVLLVSLFANRWGRIGGPELRSPDVSTERANS